MTTTPNISELARKAMVTESEVETSLDGTRHVTQAKKLAILEFRNSATPERWLALTARIDELEKGLALFACNCTEFKCAVFHGKTGCKHYTAARLLHPTPEGKP